MASPPMRGHRHDVDLLRLGEVVVARMVAVQFRGADDQQRDGCGNDEGDSEDQHRPILGERAPHRCFRRGPGHDS